MAKNRAMAMKRLKMKKMMQKEKKEKFYIRASHPWHLEELPASAEWFFKRDVVAATKMWWEV